MNHLRGDPTCIHTNCSTQKKDSITLPKSPNSKPTKAPKRNITHNQKLTETLNLQQTRQEIKTPIRKGKTSRSKIRSDQRPIL